MITRPYLIAEIGMNHEGSIDNAFEMIQQISSAGWNAAKFQTYEANTLASKSNSPAYWDTSKETETSQFELFSRLKKFSPDEYEKLSDECRRVGVDFLSTPFDEHSLRLLSPRMSAIKIASADITNVPHLRSCAETSKPLILSCGAASDSEIDRALEVLSISGAKDVTLMHCILNYPTKDSNASMWRVGELKTKYSPRRVGYSDHTIFRSGEISALAVAASQGATVFEKHFTLNKKLPGNDHYHSADFHDLVEIYRQVEQALTLFGEEGSDFLSHQSTARHNARRRIFTNRAVTAGQILKPHDLIPLRANVGIEIEHWDSVIGRAVLHNLSEDEPLTWEKIG